MIHAKIYTKNSAGDARTLFGVSEPITVRVEVWNGDKTALDFNKDTVALVFSSNGREWWIRLDFSAGVAERTFDAGVFPAGTYETPESFESMPIQAHRMIVVI